MTHSLHAAAAAPAELARARRVFYATAALTLLLKVMLAATFPMTGDEAFFYQWGVHPAWGYSDHPPMVGWWLAGLHAISDAPLVLRSATVLLTTLIGIGVVDLARRFLPAEREASAWWAGAVYLALPWSWMFVLVTTDTPLIFFMALSAWCFLRAESLERPRLGWYALAGLCVGLAFLSKYFGALLGLAYAVYVLGWRRERWWTLPWMAFFALPSIALNLGFNATHGWANIMFNFINRNEGSHWQLGTFALYAAMLLYLLTPWLLWASRRAQAAPPPMGRTVLLLWAFPFLVFALLGLRRSIGLHWVLGFVPLFVLWAGLRLRPEALRSALRWNMVLSLPHLLLVAAIVWAPLAWWQQSKLYEKVVFLREAPAVLQGLRQGMPEGAHLMAHAYSPAASLAYVAGEYVSVYGEGRHHSRQDDQLVDFRAWDGHDVRVFFRDPVNLQDHAAFFERVSLKTFEVHGVTYYALDGEGFKYAAYRELVLARIVDHFYAIPKWLPLWGSPFCERYGFAQCMPTAHPHSAP